MIFCPNSYDFLTIQRKPDGKSNAFIFACGMDGAMMQLYDLFGDGKPQPCTARRRGSRRIQSEKLFEYAAQLIGRNGAAMIFHYDLHTLCLCGHGKGNRAVFIAVIDCVADEIIQYAFQLVWIAYKLNAGHQIRLPEKPFFRQDGGKFAEDMAKNKCKADALQLQR